MNKSANKAADKAIDKASDKEVNKDANNTGVNDTEKDFIGSNEGALKSVTSILNIPTEVKEENENSESVEDVLEGENSSKEESSYSSKKESEDDDFDFSDMGVESEMFEDYDLMAEIGIELIDMGFTYGAMAIAKDFENEDKYSVKESRKRRLKKPLGLLLKNREQKVSPEVMFFVMLAATYSPVMISAVKARKEKADMEKKKAVAKKKGILTQDYVDVMQEQMEKNFKSSPAAVVPMEEPKPKGRPKGATDISSRAAVSEDDRGEMMKKAKRMKDSGKSYSSIAKELSVSQATAIRWVKNAGKK